MSHFGRGSLIVLAALSLAGCASVAQRPLPPDVRLDSVRVSKVSAGDTRRAFRLAVKNPNGYDLVVNELDYSIAVEALPLARGSSITKQREAHSCRTGRGCRSRSAARSMSANCSSVRDDGAGIHEDAR